MKKYLIILIILTGILLATTVQAEQIDNFETYIQINQDSSIDVIEQIDYNFGDLERHGIFRFIPIKYEARGGNFNLRISNIWVTDENTQPYNFKVSYPGDNVEIKIGDADIFITGAKTYLIGYTVERAINYFDDHDELYWNATGNEWTVPILKAKATVFLPSSTDTLQKKCFIGGYGEGESCDSMILAFDEQNNRIGQIFEQENLDYYQGLTIILGWPKNIVIEPTKQQQILDTVIDNLILGLPILVFIFIYYLWYTRGKDPKGRGTIIAQFGPPHKLTPAQVGTIYDEKAHKKDISAEIINLAVNGYLKITRHEKGKILKLHDYTFTKLKNADDKLNIFQKKLSDSIFGSKDEVKLSILKNKFYQDLTTITDQVYTSTVTEKYFIKNPKAVRLTYRGISFVAFFIAIFIAPFFGVFGLFSLLLSASLIFIFSFFMPKKTKKGAIAKENILGLKEYLKVAEKERIKFHNAPEKNPQHFEKLLPYAMVLDVEKDWAKQFSNIYQDQTPSWYSDPTTPNFSAFSLADSLKGFTNQANTSLSSRPSSAAGGTSGFSSSGGFSGGGFGGGGGGSW